MAGIDVGPHFDVILVLLILFLITPRLLARSTLFPYTTLFRSMSLASEFRVRARPSSCATYPIERNWSSCSALALRPNMMTSFVRWRSEEHTSELQTTHRAVCRILLGKK